SFRSLLLLQLFWRRWPTLPPQSQITALYYFQFVMVLDVIHCLLTHLGNLSRFRPISTSTQENHVADFDKTPGILTKHLIQFMGHTCFNIKALISSKEITALSKGERGHIYVLFLLRASIFYYVLLRLKAYTHVNVLNIYSHLRNSHIFKFTNLSCHVIYVYIYMVKFLTHYSLLIVFGYIHHIFLKEVYHVWNYDIRKNETGIILKLAFEKANDKVNWDFINGWKKWLCDHLSPIHKKMIFSMIALKNSHIYDICQEKRKKKYHLPLAKNRYKKYFDVNDIQNIKVKNSDSSVWKNLMKGHLCVSEPNLFEICEDKNILKHFTVNSIKYLKTNNDTQIVLKSKKQDFFILMEESLHNQRLFFPSNGAFAILIDFSSSIIQLI
ncbi:hypothetical protein ACJX0J_019974, partial [Zea mays]